MKRVPVSVVLTASGSREEFRSALAALRPTLGVLDEVACVVPAGRADLRAETGAQPWLTGYADRAAALAATTGPVVVLLDGDVVMSAHWLDQVAGAFDDPAVVAAGPRCHRSYGPQGVDLPADAAGSPAAFRAHAREWRQRYAGQVRTVDRLGPVCVAVRRDALLGAAGPTGEVPDGDLPDGMPAGPSPDLPYEELGGRGRIVLVEGALLAHTGGPRCALRASGPAAAGSEPLLSVSMIVKDEADILGECLHAVRDFADEIVVYDTGSTDRTVAVAREYGARVVEGRWTDHFADARNRCLAHCRGRWILTVDADEVAGGDPAALRERLAAAAGSALHIQVQSTTEDGNPGHATLAVRLFRRADARYYGRVHEQVVDRVTGAALGGPSVPEVRLVHSGYTGARIAAKDKRARNLRLAELAGEQEDTPLALLNLARSRMVAGAADEAVEVCRRGLAVVGDAPLRQALLHVLAEAALLLGRPDEARDAVADLRSIARSPVTADFLTARIRYAEGDHQGVLAIVEAFPEQATDERQLILGRAQLADIEIRSLVQLGRYPDAARRLCDLAGRGELPLPLTQLAAVLEQAGENVVTIAGRVPRDAVRRLLLGAADAPVPLVDTLLEALWARWPGDAAVLAVAARAGARLVLLRAMEWSARLRRYGFAEHCTLLALAAEPARAPRDRALAAAIALEMFGDQRAVALLGRALAEVPDADGPRVLDEMQQLAPGVAAAVEPAT